MMALILGSFGIGTGEFAIMGVLQDVATGINTPVTQAGNLISAYALGVVIGTPLSILFVARFPRKTQLLLLMAFAVLGNVATTFSPEYTSLLASRFAAGLPHGAYFGVASLVAANLFPPSQRGKAVGWIMLGITSATLVGNPMCTFIGQAAGWREVFGIISLIEVIAAVLIAVFLTRNEEEPASSPIKEFGALLNRQVWFTLAVGAIGFGGVFAVVGYVAPALTSAASMSPTLLPYVLLVFGLGMTAGNYVGGRSADKNLTATIMLALGWGLFTMLLYTKLMTNPYGAFLGIFLIGTNMALVAPLQVRLMDVAGNAQTLAASLNHSALNLANAIGPWLVGIAIDMKYGWESTGYIGAVLSAVGAAIFLVSLHSEKTMDSAYAR
ncbi:MFS transporter [Aquabacterium sp.]|uniref:MFS transporter n=1 Tax=Aquabacterium sp. TaxID=1872578 RepID=UPI0025BE240E|nr:MFS transporter [Aquabacterium sp.]